MRRGREGRVPGISAVLAFDCRLGGHVWEIQHDSRGMGNGLADGMGCLRMGCLSEPIREIFVCLRPQERA